MSKGQLANIGGGIANSTSLLELFALLEEQTGTKLDYRKLPPRESDHWVFVSGITKAERLLGWNPNVSAYEGIRQLMERASEFVF